MDGEEHPRTGVTGLAWRIDQFLKTRAGWPYRWILAAGLMVGMSGSATTIASAFDARTFASLTTAGIALATAAFQGLLLINQLAQVSEARRERRVRRAAKRSA
jgi:hypothetical protein